VRYRTADPHTINPRVLEALTEAQIPVVTLSEVPRSLESVYLRAVESEAGMEVSYA
jgi:ABC-2 type transport system ATP-binding protein